MISYRGALLGLLALICVVVGGAVALSASRPGPAVHAVAVLSVVLGVGIGAACVAHWAAGRRGGGGSP